VSEGWRDGAAHAIDMLRILIDDTETRRKIDAVADELAASLQRDHTRALDHLISISRRRTAYALPSTSPASGTYAATRGKR